jgi:ABC-type transport system involved in multi-copper enzyme maturation permease subunit
MRLFAVLLWIDLRRYWMFLALFAAMTALMPLTVTGAGAAREARAYQMLVAFGVLVCGVLTPFWLIAMDRLHQSMLLLWRLPISRLKVVACKLAIAVAVNLCVILVCGSFVFAEGGIDRMQLSDLFAFGVPVSILVTCICVPIYFLTNPQIGSIVGVFAGGLAATFFEQMITALLPTSRALTLVLAYGVVVAACLVCTIGTARQVEQGSGLS